MFAAGQHGLGWVLGLNRVVSTEEIELTLAPRHEANEHAGMAEAPWSEGHSWASTTTAKRLDDVGARYTSRGHDTGALRSFERSPSNDGSIDICLNRLCR
jgi:hypothetical protein